MSATLTVGTVARRTGWLLPTLAAAFFLSGISGLIYQVLWLRLLALVFGVTVWAATAVLASFMGGLALGSFAAGRLSDRVRSPLRWFAAVELLVGVTALASPVLLRGVESLYASLYPALPQSLGPLTAVRFALASAVLLVPTTLMGATLPLVVKSSLASSRGGLGERVSLLYGTNTAGAIVGTLLAGFVLVGAIGIGASFRLAAGLNAVVALIALTASFLGERQDGEHGEVVAERPDEAIPEPMRRLVLVVFAMSGFASLAQEVIWFRVLVLFQQVTTYAFTVMLATFLCGIAAGSWLAAPLMRRRLDGLRTLGLLEVGIAVVSLLSLTALTWSFRWVEGAERLFGRQLSDTLTLLGAASFLAVFPATLLMGIAFPIGLRLWSAGAREGTGSRIGAFYSLNVLGSILGAAAAGFVLLPLLGSRGSLVAVSAVSLVGGLLLLGRGWRSIAGAAVFALAALTVPSPFDAVLAHRHKGEQPIWREEGVQTTVAVHKAPHGDLMLYLDGWPQASDNPGGVAVHRLIGHLPMVLHPEPRDALVIGLGGGATPGAVALHPGVNVDVVELSSSVVRGSDYLRHANQDVLSRPNVRLLVDDGRNHLLLSGKTYDVITADLIWPLHAGAGNLYSAEYYRLAREALRDDGLMLQWVGARSEAQYTLVARTFRSVFPEATLWFNNNLLVGSKRPLRIDRGAFERRMQDPGTREAMRAVGINDFDGLVAMFRSGPAGLGRFLGEGEILTDDRPRVEYFRSLPDQKREPDFTGLQESWRPYVRD